ncbi:MAG: hypothetical protein ACLP00_08425, partial [Terracidiphilus sp.]
MFFQEHCKKAGVPEARQKSGFTHGIELFPTTLRILRCSIPAKTLGNARKPKRSDVDSFFLYSPILASMFPTPSGRITFVVTCKKFLPARWQVAAAFLA